MFVKRHDVQMSMENRLSSLSEDEFNELLSLKGEALTKRLEDVLH